MWVQEVQGFKVTASEQWCPFTGKFRECEILEKTKCGQNLPGCLLMLRESGVIVVQSTVYDEEIIFDRV